MAGYFHVHVHHGGRFRSGRGDYVGKVCTLQCDPDKWSYWEILDILKEELRYIDIESLWFYNGNEDHPSGLTVIKDDQGATKMINIARVDGYAELFVIHKVSQPFIDLDNDDEGGPAEGVGVGKSVDAGGVGVGQYVDAWGVGVGQTVGAEGVGLDQGMSEGVGPGLCKGVGPGLGKDVVAGNRSDEESESSEDDDSQDEDVVITDESETTETDDDDLTDEENGGNSDDSALNIRFHDSEEEQYLKYGFDGVNVECFGHGFEPVNGDDYVEVDFPNATEPVQTEAGTEAPRSASTEVAAESEIQAKKRGRPKRNPTTSVNDKNSEVRAPKKRGRPKKSSQPASNTSLVNFDESQHSGNDSLTESHGAAAANLDDPHGLSYSEYGSEELDSGGDSDEDNVVKRRKLPTFQMPKKMTDYK
ncbi:hypothetical protein RIF29_12387 [Crotalaria pallida]|uniref:PB1-like domain-containing protein n=1 Tax=Crotalaria pallida TaxID=3830 RepID=A0AAN9IN39_CROPI